MGGKLRQAAPTSQSMPFEYASPLIGALSSQKSFWLEFHRLRPSKSQASFFSCTKCLPNCFVVDKPATERKIGEAEYSSNPMQLQLECSRKLVAIMSGLGHFSSTVSKCPCPCRRKCQPAAWATLDTTTLSHKTFIV